MRSRRGALPLRPRRDGESVHAPRTSSRRRCSPTWASSASSTSSSGRCRRSASSGGRLKRVRVEGHRQFNPGWHLALDLALAPGLRRGGGAGGDRAEGEPRRSRPRRLPEAGSGVRQGEHGGAQARRGSGGVRRADPRDARRAEGSARGVKRMARAAKLRIWRGDAAGGRAPRLRRPLGGGHGRPRRAARLQATQAGDLAVRWNCKAGKCGSCSAEVNGKPRLMCMTRMNSLDPRRRSPWRR